MTSAGEVWLRWREIGEHGEKCLCHPIRLGCCDRWPADGVFLPGHVDAIDDRGFGWHMRWPCRPAATTARRALSGEQPRYIGDDEAKRDG